MNLTLSEEAIGLNCELKNFNNILSGANCEIDYAPAIFFPNLGVRGEI